VGEWGVRGGAELLYDDELWYDESRDEDFEVVRSYCTTTNYGTTKVETKTSKSCDLKGCWQN
jgi:hypothetical protein